MGLTFIAVVLLAAAWAAILLPDLRNRAGSSRRSDPVKSFRQQLSGLDRTRPVSGRGQSAYGRPVAGAPAARRPRPAGPAARAGGLGPRAGAPARPLAARPAPRSAFLPRSSAEAAMRRRLVLGVLVGLAVLTLLGGVVVSGALLVLHLLVDATLGVYAYLLWERGTRTRSRASSFLTLDADDDDVVVRREAAGG